MKDQSNFSYTFLLTKHKNTKLELNWTRSKQTQHLSITLVCVAHTNTQPIKFNTKKKIINLRYKNQQVTKSNLPKLDPNMNKHTQANMGPNLNKNTSKFE